MIGPTKRKLNDEEDENKRESKVQKSCSIEKEAKTKTDSVESNSDKVAVKEEVKDEEVKDEEINGTEEVNVKEESIDEQMKTDMSEETKTENSEDVKEKKTDQPKKDKKTDEKSTSFSGMLLTDSFKSFKETA